jgi:hypothetical protein
MKAIIIFALLLITCFSCKKDSPKPVTLSDANLQGKWRLISETRSGSFNARYEGLSTDYIEYKSDGKAYSFIQGQYGLIYTYNLNTTDKTLNFMYINHVNNPPHPCTTSPGCPRLAHVNFFSKDLLLLGNTYLDTISGQVYTLTLVDSLTR